MSLETCPRRLVIHTTETGQSWPDWSAQGTGLPHATVSLKTGEVRQHLPFDMAAYTLKAGERSPNSEGGITIQIEILGYAAESPSWSDDEYDRLRDLLLWFEENLGIPYEFPFPFAGDDGYGTGGAVRQTWDAWATASGVVGHAHAPAPNAHWDPGRLDVHRLEHGAAPGPLPSWLEEFVRSNWAPIVIVGTLVLLVLAVLFAG